MLRRIIAASLISSLLPAAAWADEITDRIRAATKSYEENKLGHAASTLQVALAKLRDKLEERLEAAMPPPPEGWTANEHARRAPTPRNWSTALGSNLQRTYTDRIGGRITVSLALDNPMVWSQAGTHIAMMSPGYAEQMGYTPVAIEGLAGGAAFYRWTERSNSGEGVILIPGRLLVRINAHGGAAFQPMRAMIQGWDIKRMKEIADIE